MLLPSSAIYAPCEVRRQEFFADAAQRRLAATAIVSRIDQEDTMFEDHHHAIVQRGLDEALACRDMLTPAPAPPSRWARILAHLVTAADAFARYDSGSAHWRRSEISPSHDRFSLPLWRLTTSRFWR